jgi:hypothetical protein
MFFMYKIRWLRRSFHFSVMTAPSRVLKELIIKDLFISQGVICNLTHPLQQKVCASCRARRASRFLAAGRIREIAKLAWAGSIGSKSDGHIGIEASKLQRLAKLPPCRWFYLVNSDQYRRLPPNNLVKLFSQDEFCLCSTQWLGWKFKKC